MMSIELELPDGGKRSCEDGATVYDVVASIGEGLARAAVAGVVNGRELDLMQPVPEAGSFRVLTFRDEEGQDVYRHTSTHIMAQAVKRLWPETKLAVGPAIQDGFFYDVDPPQPLTPEDLGAIEAEMKKIVKENLPIAREEFSLADAIALFKELGEAYKVELLEGMPEDEVVTVYRQGEFVDLCRGPHLPSTGRVKALKLLSVAGAYWKGDQANAQLQRIYGTSFPDKKQLEEHLQLLEEAKQRDHRRIGRDLDLFSFHEEGPGFPFFHHKGVIVFNELIEACRAELRRLGYQEIMTPMILHESLWHRSGHWDNYKENMYFTRIDERPFAVKPMNCPGGLLVFRNGLHSYRELPLKIAEFGQVHRHELSGVLHGLFRVRMFTQDDAHVYCTPELLEDQVIECIELCLRIYAMVGFEDVRIELSTRPEKSIGSDEMWENATGALERSLERKGIQYQLNPGDGAFYGPKIDFHIKDCLRRSWQCGTIQVDFSMPERFDLSYVGADGGKHRPVMIHRALFGSLERFIGILLEHCAGNLPLWLAPVQVVLLPIAERHVAAAREMGKRLFDAGLRVEVDDQNAKIGAKIRNAELRKAPCMLVVGDREAETGTVSVRRHLLGDCGSLPLEELLGRLKEEIATKALEPTGFCAKS